MSDDKSLEQMVNCHINGDGEIVGKNHKLEWYREAYEQTCIQLNEMRRERDQLKTALQEVADYPLSDYGGVIARKALGIPE